MEKEENVKEESGNFCLKIMDYTITMDKYQYIVDGTINFGKDKNGVEQKSNIHNYHRTLASALSSIRDDNMRASTIGSKTLDEAIDRMQAFDVKFSKLLEPLKKFEN